MDRRDIESPLLAPRAGIGSQLQVAAKVDPVFQERVTFNQSLVLQDKPVGTEAPLEDGRSYVVEGKPEPRCRPYLRLVDDDSGLIPGPRLRFERRSDGMYLTATFEEDMAQRVAGALPFDVRVASLALHYRNNQVLQFSPPQQVAAANPATEPAFRIDVEAKAPPDRQEQLAEDLRGPGRASWQARLEFEWEKAASPDLDLAQLAPHARWSSLQFQNANLAGIWDIPWMGSDGDDRGFARFDTVTMEDGSTVPALRTHPKWTPGGGISGQFYNLKAPFQPTFQARLGYLSGVSISTGLTFVVKVLAPGIGWTEIYSLTKGYDGSLSSASVDLSPYVGPDGTLSIELSVLAGDASDQDWAAWVNPIIYAASGPVFDPTPIPMPADPVPPVEPGPRKPRPAETPPINPREPAETMLASRAASRLVVVQPGDAGTAVPGDIIPISIDRNWLAEYPNTGRNRPIYAAIDGNYAMASWQSTAHGWFQPTPIQDTVYCLPDRYLLAVDEVRGLPSILAVLLRKNPDGTLVDDLDPAMYRTRLTMNVLPDFSPDRINNLRTLIRGQSSNTIKYADLVLGGYQEARFVPDPTLTELGLTGTVHGGQQAIDPANGFAVTYEGDAEFIDLIYQRLKGEGVRGHVELDLLDAGGTIRKQQVPINLTLNQLAAVRLPWRPVPPAGTEPQWAGARFQLTNQTARKVTVDGVLAFALARSLTGHVDAWYPATPEALSQPFALAASEVKDIVLRTNPPDALTNGWDIAVRQAKPELTGQLVLSALFDAATSGVRGWKVNISSPTLKFFDQLKPEEQQALAELEAIEVEVRRVGGTGSVEDIQLTKAAPEGSVLLTRTVADFIADRSTGRSTFQWRRRLNFRSRAGDWTEWADENGSNLTVYPQT